MLHLGNKICGHIWLYTVAVRQRGVIITSGDVIAIETDLLSLFLEILKFRYKFLIAATLLQCPGRL